MELTVYALKLSYLLEKLEKDTKRYDKAPCDSKVLTIEKDRRLIAKFIRETDKLRTVSGSLMGNEWGIDYRKEVV